MKWRLIAGGWHLTDAPIWKTGVGYLYKTRCGLELTRIRPALVAAVTPAGDKVCSKCKSINGQTPLDK